MSGISGPVAVSFLTYNIDGRENDYSARLDVALDQIKKSGADIVAIQEGSYLTYERLFREMGQMGYKKAFPEEVRKKKSGEALFSRLPIVKTEYIPFRNTYESRGVTGYLVDVSGEHIWFSTAQFEDGVAIRRMQLAQMEAFFSRNPESAIFGGDTRIHTYQRFGSPKGWGDAWQEIGSPDEEYTVDWETNQAVQPPLRSRQDRIWYQEKRTPLECVEFKLVGKDGEIKASTHFGVFAKFSIFGTG